MSKRKDTDFKADTVPFFGQVCSSSMLGRRRTWGKLRVRCVRTAPPSVALCSAVCGFLPCRWCLFAVSVVSFCGVFGHVSATVWLRERWPGCAVPRGGEEGALGRCRAHTLKAGSPVAAGLCLFMALRPLPPRRGLRRRQLAVAGTPSLSTSTSIGLRPPTKHSTAMTISRRPIRRIMTLLPVSPRKLNRRVDARRM